MVNREYIDNVKTTDEYLDAMRLLNEEEHVLRNNNEDLTDFYERKNILSVKFLESLLAGEIDKTHINVSYYKKDYSQYRESKVFSAGDYYNKIFIKDGNTKFTILPPVIREKAPELMEKLYINETTLSSVFDSISYEDGSIRFFSYDKKEFRDALIEHFNKSNNINKDNMEKILNDYSFRYDKSSNEEYNDYILDSKVYQTIVICNTILEKEFLDVYDSILDEVYYFNIEELDQAQLGIENNLTQEQILTYMTPRFDADQMEQIRLGLEYNVEHPDNPIDVSIYATNKFNADQMNEIRLGLEKGLDVSIYTDENLDWDEMEEIRFRLEEEQSIIKEVCLKASQGKEDFDNQVNQSIQSSEVVDDIQDKQNIPGEQDISSNDENDIDEI